MQELIQLVLDNMKQYQFEWELFIEIHGTASNMILKNISYLSTVEYINLKCKLHLFTNIFLFSFRRGSIFIGHRC